MDPENTCSLGHPGCFDTYRFDTYRKESDVPRGFASSDLQDMQAVLKVLDEFETVTFNGIVEINEDKFVVQYNELEDRHELVIA